jgi:hypothetical protein
MSIKPSDQGKLVRFVPNRVSGRLVQVTATHAFVVSDVDGHLVGGTWDQVVVLEEQRPYVPPAARKFREKTRRQSVSNYWMLIALVQGRCIQCFQHALVVTTPEDGHCKSCGAKFWVKSPTEVVATYVMRIV